MAGFSDDGRLPHASSGSVPRTSKARRPRSRARIAATGARSPSPASSTSCSAPTSGRSRSRHRSPICGPRPHRGSSSTSRTWPPPLARSSPSGSRRSGGFRNRSPGNFIFATASSSRWMEFFVHPSREDGRFGYWVAELCAGGPMWGSAPISCGCTARPRRAVALQRRATDISTSSIGWSELEGSPIAPTTPEAHATASPKSLSIFDGATGRHVRLRDRAGHGGRPRAVLTVLLDACEGSGSKGRSGSSCICAHRWHRSRWRCPLLRNRPGWSRMGAARRRPEAR